MSNHFSRFVLWSLLIVPCLFVGCGKRGPAVNPVAGTVTIDGQPLTDASIRFTPKGKSEAEGAAGSVDASGNLAGIKTLSTGDSGIVAGEYIVTVSKMKEKLTNQTYTDPATGNVIKIMSGEETMPKIYTAVDTSPLTATIQKGENTLKLEVKSQ